MNREEYYKQKIRHHDDAAQYHSDRQQTSLGANGEYHHKQEEYHRNESAKLHDKLKKSEMCYCGKSYEEHFSPEGNWKFRHEFKPMEKDIGPISTPMAPLSD